MRATILLAACLLLAGAAAGCTSSDGYSTPVSTPTATPTAATAAPLADRIAACTDAIAAGRDEGDGAPECADLSPDDYLTALEDANQQGRDALSSALDDATTTP